MRISEHTSLVISAVVTTVLLLVESLLLFVVINSEKLYVSKSICVGSIIVLWFITAWFILVMLYCIQELKNKPDNAQP